MSDKTVETKVIELKDDNGNVVERITETWVEKVPMELKNRKVERISYAPVVLEAFVENYEDGKIADQADTKGMTAKQALDGLSDMKNRVIGAIKTTDVVVYGIILVLLCIIGYNMFF